MTLATTPQPPYFAVIFTSLRTNIQDGYDDMSIQLVELAKTQPGYISIESARDASGMGITVSYWESEEAILNWKQQATHVFAQQKGKEEWYKQYHVRVCKVERAYSF
jgi:heme-degrading monooxygenase HmoA